MSKERAIYSLTEPDEWFHDIFRQDGSPYSKEEITFIKKILLNKEE